MTEALENIQFVFKDVQFIGEFSIRCEKSVLFKSICRAELQCEISIWTFSLDHSTKGTFPQILDNFVLVVHLVIVAVVPFLELIGFFCDRLKRRILPAAEGRLMEEPREVFQVIELLLHVLFWFLALFLPVHLNSQINYIQLVFAITQIERITMLHYNWKDFIVSAQLICDQILVDAVPANIRKISIESQDIENIEKAFQGEVTPAYLSTIFPEQVKQLRSISIFYQEMCKCFNQAHKDKKEGSILILREWCYDQAALNRKQRMTIKFCIAHESRQIECVVRLKEVYLTPNGLLLKSNTIIFNQLEYYRKAEKKQAKQVKLVEQRITAKVDKQLMGYKELINGLLQEIKKMREQGQKNESIGNSKRSKKASRNEMKIEQMSEQPAKQRRRPHSIGLDYAKLEENMKHEEDQQSKRLKILEDSCPESKVTPFPIQFDQTNPAYHFFSFSNGSVTKIGGFDYPMAILKDTIPFEGTHGAIIKYVIQKKIKRSCCLEIGIIDENNKTLLHSSVSDNYIFFKFNVSTVCTKVKGLEKKKRFGKLRPLVPGEYVEMRVNLSLGIISWASSFGEIVRAQIPQDLRKMKLQPFVGIFTTGDMVEFLDYPQ